MSSLILYRAVISPPSRAVMMLADLVGVPLDIKDVDITTAENRTAQFKKLNPMQTVPVLQDGDFVISDSHAIMKYLLMQYGGESLREELYPSEVRTCALVDQCMFYNTGVFFPHLRAIAANTFKGASGPADHQKRSIEASYKVINAFLEQRSYIATDHMTLADLSAGSTASALQVMHKVNAAKYPRCVAWLSRLGEQPVFQRHMAPGTAAIADLMTTMWERNKNNIKQ